MSTIVILENEPIFALMATRKIKGTGSVLHVLSRGELLQTLPLITADLFLVDRELGKPGEQLALNNDGIQLIPIIRRLHPNAKVIVWSSRDDAFSVLEARKAGADGFISKIRSSSLIADIEKVITASQWIECVTEG